MPAYFVEPCAGSPGDIHTAALNTVGSERRASDGNIYKYLPGCAATIAGSWVAYDELGVTVGLDTDVATSIVSCVAIATAATVANTWGWYGIEGVFPAGAVTVADNAKVFATATVFICDDLSVAGSQIVPAVWRSANSGALASVEIHRPFCGINVA